MNAIPLGHKMTTGLILLVIPENDDNREDTPLLTCLLLSTHKLPLILPPNI